MYMYCCNISSGSRRMLFICTISSGWADWACLGVLQHQKIPWVWQLGDAVPYHLCSTQTREGLPGEEFWGRPEPGLTAAFSQMVEGVFICCSSRLVAEIAGYGIELRGRVERSPYWFSWRAFDKSRTAP